LDVYGTKKSQDLLNNCINQQTLIINILLFCV